ncbi:MAG: hypothetical protein MUF22_09655, partial [Chitinispirillaceae bacterium]|nr:hypothetical protein [Chitinispirillaceae bacterium]
MKHIAVLFAFLISALTTMATETRPVAVLNIRSADLDSNQLRTLTGALISELRPLILPRKMMSWEEIKSIMSHAVMKNMMGCDETQCLMDLAGELDASAIVSGDISKISDKLFVLNIKMVSVEKPDEANSAYVKATNIEELFDKFPEVAKKLVGTPAAPAAAAVKSPEPVTLTASLASAAVSAPAASRAPVAEQKREATPRKRVLQPVASVKAPEQKKEIPAPAESAVSSP